MKTKLSKTFKPKQAGRSFSNWGEALLVTEHLRQLFTNLEQPQRAQIAYFALCQAQTNQIRYIFGIVLIHLFNKI